MENILEEKIFEIAEHFRLTYKEKYPNLNYSEKSLIEIENILDTISDLLDPEENKEEIENFSDPCACYILWTCKQIHGGNFAIRQDLIHPSLIVGLPESKIELYAYDKVKGRIINGKEDSILSFYNEFKERILENRLDDNVSFI